MSWLEFFLFLWAVIMFFTVMFVVVDARNAYDGDPSTATLSGYIKRWRRKKPGRSYLLTGVILFLALIPIYLFVHLVLEAI